jgi:hypothetical protein
LILAADHTARGKISLGLDPIAMSDRFTLLDRLTRCLALPGVDGVLASADILEELAFLGALDNKLAIGTMNRGGIIGASWELDDRLTSYDADHIESMGLDGGKTLIRIDYNDPSVARTIETVAALTTQLADRKLMAMIEPLPYKKNAEDNGQPGLFTYSGTVDVRNLTELTRVGNTLLEMSRKFAPMQITTVRAKTYEEITFRQIDFTIHDEIEYPTWFRLKNDIAIGQQVGVELLNYGIDDSLLVTGKTHQITPDSWTITYDLWKGFTA